MLGLAHELEPEVTSSFLCFSEGNRCQAFLNQVGKSGFTAVALTYDTPRLVAAAKELKRQVQQISPNVLCTHGYKSNLLGLWCARQLHIPIISVSHGWTGESRRVRLYEWLDRKLLPRMDRVVAVSHRQALRVCRANVSKRKLAVIHDAVSMDRFNSPRDTVFRQRMESLFDTRPSLIIGAAGRLSPEKGFDVLIEACRTLKSSSPTNFGIVLFGDGQLHANLQRHISDSRLGDCFKLAGFTTELDKFMPNFDLFVQSSHTEGLPNVLLEAAAAGVPVIATDVGGTGEAVVEGRTGLLVPSGNSNALAESIMRLLKDALLRENMRASAPAHVAENFSFLRHAAAYRALLQSLLSSNGG